MRLTAALALIAAAAAALAWLAVARDATGAENGVLWAIGIVAALALFGVVAATVERAWYS